MRTVVFQMLHDILCDNDSYVHKFATTITNKWLLLFLEKESDPLSIILAARVFAKLCSVRGSSYVQNFRSANGFVILKRLLSEFWHMPQLHEILMLTMLGIDASKFPIYDVFDIKNIRDYLENDVRPDFKMIIPDLIPVILAMLNEGNLMKTGDIGFLGDFVQLFSEIYDSVHQLKEAYNKEDTVDFAIQILFTSLYDTLPYTVEEELGSTDALLNNHDSDYAGSSASSITSSINGSQFAERFSKSLDDDTTSTDSVTTMENNVVRRGGASALMTKTSPHVFKRDNSATSKLKYVLF